MINDNVYYIQFDVNIAIKNIIDNLLICLLSRFHNIYIKYKS